MLEAVLPLRNGLQLADQVGPLGGQQVLVQARLRPDDSREDSSLEAAPDHRKGLQRGSGLAQPIDAGDDQRLVASRPIGAEGAEIG